MGHFRGVTHTTSANFTGTASKYACSEQCAHYGTIMYYRYSLMLDFGCDEMDFKFYPGANEVEQNMEKQDLLILIRTFGVTLDLLEAFQKINLFSLII